MPNTPDGVNPEQLTIVARRVLLDGLMALESHLAAITVVGAQAVYLRTPNAAIAAAAYTSDGDLGIDPAVLGDAPLVDEVLHDAGFTLRNADQPGLWVRPETVGDQLVHVELDVLVGSSLASGGRGARIPPHGKMCAKKVPGIEVAVVDRSPMLVTSLEPDDLRGVTVHVAGAAALLVCKAYKINDRLRDAEKGRADRLVNKDAGDVLRIMMVSPAARVGDSFRGVIADSRVGSVAAEGLRLLRQLFGGADTPGVRMAVEALSGSVPAERVRALAPAFVNRLPDGPP
jgi:hypothetical protein